MKAYVIGDEHLYRRFRQMADAGRGRKIEGALKVGGLVIATEAKIIVRKRTGNLARSIHVGGYGHQSELSLSDGTDIGGNMASRDGAEIRVGTNVIYARWIEFRVESFLRAAFDTKRREAVKEIHRAFGKLLK